MAIAFFLTHLVTLSMLLVDCFHTAITGTYRVVSLPLLVSRPLPGQHLDRFLFFPLPPAFSRRLAASQAQLD